MTPTEMGAVIDGWWFAVQRSIIRHRGDLQFDLMMAGIHAPANPSHPSTTR